MLFYAIVFQNCIALIVIIKCKHAPGKLQLAVGFRTLFIKNVVVMLLHKGSVPLHPFTLPSCLVLCSCFSLPVQYFGACVHSEMFTIQMTNQSSHWTQQLNTCANLPLGAKGKERHFEGQMKNIQKGVCCGEKPIVRTPNYS